MEGETIRVITSDGKESLILASLTKNSATLKNLLEDQGEDAFKNGIHLGQDVTAETFGKVVEYWMHHANDEPAPAAAAAAPTDTTTGLPANIPELSEWDKEYAEGMTQDQKFAVILAANYLESKTLLEILCRSVANSVLGKTPKEIYAMYGVEKELTPEEEAEVRKENPWLEDN